MADSKKHTPIFTPIKRSMVHQEEGKADKYSEEEDRFQAYDTVFNGREVLVHFDENTGDVIIDGKLYHTKVEELEENFIVTVEHNHDYKIEMIDGEIYLEGRLIEFTYNPATPKLERKRTTRVGENVVKAPLPGHVVEIFVRVGDQVDIGDKLLTLEAMKMQNDILSDAQGTIKELHIRNGDQVNTDQKLLIIYTKLERSEDQ